MSAQIEELCNQGENPKVMSRRLPRRRAFGERRRRVGMPFALDLTWVRRLNREGRNGVQEDDASTDGCRGLGIGAVLRRHDESTGNREHEIC
jgi:hypothetical protein